ncbi:hypothetical protein [Paenibacillus sp. PL2-23]|uniref:hypothetical protein n=1 Tax=Paenibacillus sp. PL2-23 TaxID=2100729 RepID=UPI0030F922EB
MSINKVRIPAYLHEIFGREQSVIAIITILTFGTACAAVLFSIYPSIHEELPLWRSLFAYLLVFDVLCGCIANFTRSTSDYYAAHPRKRLLFIFVHVHILLIAALLEAPMLDSVLVWLYTAACALFINAQRGSRQLMLGGVLLATGLVWIPMQQGGGPFMTIVSQLFMLKVVFSFAVDHYGGRDFVHTSGD